LKRLLVVGLGGALGSLIRYLTVSKGDEIGLFLVNISGVAVAGFIALRLSTSELVRLALIPGFAGGLTTFSSVAVIHVEDSLLRSIAYFFGSVLVSLMILFAIKPRAKI
jgi:fluoride ion exporter CrcB/FEX